MTHSHQGTVQALSERTRSRALPVAICGLCFLAGAYFAGSILYHILRYGVQVPFWDEWNFLQEVRRFGLGQLSLADLLLSHQGEHRMGVQVLSTMFLVRLMGMNVRLMMVLNWGLSLALTILVALITGKGLQTRGILPWVVWAMASLFIFNPAGYQLWMWSILPVYLFVPLLFLAGVHAAQYRAPAVVPIGTAAVAALVASFAFGAGLLLWLLFPAALVPLLGRRKVLRARLAAGLYGALWLLAAVTYLQGIFVFRSPAPQAKSSLRVLVSFFLAYTGNLVSGLAVPGIVTWAHVMGLLTIVVFAIAAAGVVKSCYRTEAWPVAVVWLCVGVYATIAGILVSLARHGFGVPYAVEASRYVLSSAVFPVAATALACICISRLRTQLPGATGWYSVALASLTVLVTTSLVIRCAQTPAAWASFRQGHISELQGKTALSAANLVTVPAYRQIFPADDWSRFRTLANFVTTDAGLRPGMWDERFIQNLAALAPGNGRAGFVDRVTAEGDRLVVSGWAYLEERGEAADAVIVTGADAGQPARLLAVAFPSQLRPDVTAALHSDPELQTGWQATIPRGSLAAIHCYAYNAESGAVHALGEVSAALPR